MSDPVPLLTPDSEPNVVNFDSEVLMLDEAPTAVEAPAEATSVESMPDQEPSEIPVDGTPAEDVVTVDEPQVVEEAPQEQEQEGIVTVDEPQDEEEAPEEQEQQEHVEEPEQAVAEGEVDEQVQQADEEASKNEEDEESKNVDEMEVGEVGVGKADEAASKELAAEQAAAEKAAAAEPASMDVDEADPEPAPQEPPEQQLMQLMQDTQREQQKELKRLIWVYRWIVGLDPLSGRLIDSSKMDDLSDDEDVANSRDLPSNIRMLPIKRDAMRKLGILYSQNPKRKQSDIQEISKQLRTPENAVTSYFNYRSKNAQNQYSAAFPKKQPKLSKSNSGKHPLNPPNRPLVSKRPKQELPKLKKKEKSSMSELEISLQPCLNSDDGVKADKALNFANAISGVVDGTDQPAVLNAIAETESVACLRKLVQYGILKVLNKWMTDAKAKNNSVIIRLALRVLHSVPMTLKNMSDSGIGRTVGKMRKEKDTKTADKVIFSG